MEVKASLHIHTREDRREHNALTYGIKELVDIAAQSDFKILAITTHEIPVCRREHVAYAALKGLLLIPGVELAMREKKFGESHVVILNLEEKDFAEAQSIKDFEELGLFRKKRPNLRVLAPHPGFGFINALSRRELEKNISCFDYIEYSWFYSRFFNLNKLAVEISAKKGKPLLSTSDLHLVDFLDQDYIIVDIPDLSVQSLFDSIENRKYKNVTAPKKISSMIGFFIRLNYLYARQFFKNWESHRA